MKEESTFEGRVTGLALIILSSIISVWIIWGIYHFVNTTFFENTNHNCKEVLTVDDKERDSYYKIFLCKNNNESNRVNHRKTIAM